MDKPGGVFRLLFSALCDFARVEAHLAEARGVTLNGSPQVIVDLRRPPSIGLVMKQLDGSSKTICLRAADVALGELVTRFLEEGAPRLPLDVAQQISEERVSLALVAPLDGGVDRIACVVASRDDPHEQVTLFTAMQDEWAVGGQVH